MNNENGWPHEVSRFSMGWFWGYLRLWSFICVCGVLFAFVEFYLRSESFICVRGQVICVQQNSTPNPELKLLWFLAFRTAKSALSFGIRLLRSLGEIYARSWPVTLVRECVTLAQKILRAFSNRLRAVNKIRHKTGKPNEPQSDAFRAAESDNPQPKKAPGFPGAFIIQVPQNVTYGLSGSAGGCV
ncbi:hypothetical protein ACTL32_09965 [Planococcus sp. FY231025]|uniref:hypothetical protein n=1 Tax=Planococcus sp. FY231025 TaxID=3455699 RepID=UPI003F8F87B9